MERTQVRGVKKALGLVVVAALAFVLAGAAGDGMVALSGNAVATHDPTIVKVGDRYVRFTTGRGIPVAISSDLSVWSQAGAVFPSNPDWTSSEIPGSTDFWAPDAVYRDGEWRVYYSISTFGSNRSAIGMAVNPALDPMNPSVGWIDEGPVFQSYRTDNFNAIDPQIARDAKGADWLVFGSFWSGIKMVPLDTAGKLLPGGKRVDLAQRPEAPDAIEGGYLFPHEGKYYLFVSFDACCKGLQSTYNIRVGRSDTFEGPYVDRDGVPLLQGGGTLVKAKTGGDIGPGHNSILVDGNKTYLVYHVYDVAFGGQPRMRIQSLTWDTEGWPAAMPLPPSPFTDMEHPDPFVTLEGGVYYGTHTTTYNGFSRRELFLQPFGWDAAGFPVFGSPNRLGLTP